MIDDLDRCAADRVVKLLETVHTLLRESGGARFFPRWRAPAPLIVLVLADGRWVRTAFERQFSDFTGLGSDVHGLGADFLQKLFDHTVLVPSLSSVQVRHYLDHLLGPPDDVAGGGAPDAQRLPGAVQAETTTAESASAAESLERRVAATGGDELDPAALQEPMGRLNERDRIRVATAVAGRIASPEAAEGLRRHLLQEYAELMPTNPRLVKRVANAYGMLQAVDMHLHSNQDKDTLIRAGVVLVRFPQLVDKLLSRPTLAAVDGTTAADPWTRPDVRRVLTRADGTMLGPAELARCYGRDVSADEQPDAPTTSAAPLDRAATMSQTPDDD